VEGWKQVPILLIFEQFVDNGIVVNIKIIISAALLKFGGLSKD
jgi:hypothetical protein